MYVTSIIVSPKSITLEKDKWYHYAKATVCTTTGCCCGCYTWCSENPEVAYVNPSNGYIYANAIGTAKIYARATDGSGKEDYINVTVVKVPVESISLDKTELFLKKGTKETLTATIIPSNATNQTILWISNLPRVASVVNGEVHANAAGTATITARSPDGIGHSVSCNVEVTPQTVSVTSVRLNKAHMSLEVGEEFTLEETVEPCNATYPCVVWCSSNSAVAKVIGGRVIAVAEGFARITATSIDCCGYSASCDITVKVKNTSTTPDDNLETVPVSSVSVYPEEMTLTVGQSEILQETVLPTEAKQCVCWYSSAPDIVTVNPLTGFIMAQNVGTAIIYARSCVNSNIFGTCACTVETVNEHVDVYMAIGQTKKLSTSITPSEYVRWSSSNPSAATVNHRTGVVRALSSGNVYIYAEALYDNTSREIFIISIESSENYYTIKKKTTSNFLGIDGKYLLDLNESSTITLRDDSGTNETIWKLENLRNNRKRIRSYIDLDYVLDACDGSATCTITRYSGSESVAEVELISTNGDNEYKVKLSNYNRYLTADNNNLYWSEYQDGEEIPTWIFESIDLEQREKEKIEYHIIPFLNTQKALMIDPSRPTGGNTHFRLVSDQMLKLDPISYLNLQNWCVHGTDNSCKIFTQHGDNYCICYKGESETEVYVSNDATYETELEVISCNIDNNSESWKKVKLANRDLYLTVSENDIIWAAESKNSNTQLWKFETMPENLHNGVDTAGRLCHNTSIDPTVRALLLGKEEFIIRYYAMDDKPDEEETKKDAWKIVNNCELDAALARGLNIVIVYQDFNNKASHFSATEGQIQANRALELASQYNQPPNSAIYFAVDYDANTTDDIEAIKAYFKEIKKIFASDGRYKVGVYGNGLVCATIKELGYVEYTWLSGAFGYTNYTAYDSPQHYNMKQSQIVQYNGLDFDNDIAVGDDYGQWYNQ